MKKHVPNKVPASTKKAVLLIEGRRIELPVIEGTEGQKGIDITGLRGNNGYLTFDNGFANTSSTLSSITFVDGDNGILRYRGYDIEDLVENCTFVEVAYLLVQGKLPTASELKKFSGYLNQHSMIHEDMHHFFTGFPPNSHPMAILSAMVTSLSSFYPYLGYDDPSFDITEARLLSKVRTIAAFSYKKSRGEPVVYPRHDLSYCANFLNMMFSSPVAEYEINPGRGQGAQPAPHPARRPRAELLHLGRQARGEHGRQSVRRDLGGHFGAVGAVPRRRQPGRDRDA